MVTIKQLSRWLLLSDIAEAQRFGDHARFEQEIGRGNRSGADFLAQRSAERDTER
jgi:hypothetical protein